MITCLSLDLQGTLSRSDFSDNFWLQLLPREYAKCNRIGLKEAKQRLKNEFGKIGKYDVRYYDDSYWAALLGFDTLQLIRDCSLQPTQDAELFNLLEKINIQKIIISTTTNLFIDYELGSKKSLFVNTYSCVDALGVGGKTPEVFRMVATAQGVRPDNILHIGDNNEMDVVNAELAGVTSLLYDGNIQELVVKISKALT